MPNYTFENINTQEQYTIELPMSELDEYKKNHPEIIQVLTTANGIVDPVLLGVTKPPSDFQKHVLGKIKKGSGRDNTIGTGRWNIPV